MADMPRPTLNELTRALAHLADRVLTRRGPGLEPYMVHTLKLAIGELEMLIPGLDPVPNAEAAKAFTEAAAAALQDGEEHEALSYALRGLSCSPHDPVLWYLAGSACVEVGSLEMALRLMWHALWIHPGYGDAKRDLDALTSFFEHGEDVPTEDMKADGGLDDERAA